MHVLSYDQDGWSTPIFPSGFQAGRKWKMKMQRPHVNSVSFLMVLSTYFSSWEAIKQLMLIGHKLGISHEYP